MGTGMGFVTPVRGLVRWGKVGVVLRREDGLCRRGRVVQRRGIVSMAKDKMPEEGLIRPTINWYPGHIAKAERRLKEMISVVDVVIEMRDCRIPNSTAHPLVNKW